MSKARLVITAVVLEHRSVTEVAQTLRVAGQLRHTGIGQTYAGTYVILLVQDLDVRIVHAATAELLREHTIDRRRDYQPRNTRDPNPQ